MKWRKLGLVYAPTGDLWWAKSYALLPTATFIGDEVIRVFFASLDENRFGRIGFVELSAQDPTRVLRQSSEPVLDLGEPGTFDDCGVNPSCVIEFQEKQHLYYIGWQRCERVPYMLFSGLAVSADSGQTFQKHSRVPILDRTHEEPFSRSAPYVLVEGNVLRMWYWSCEHWSDENGSLHYNNVIRYAQSPDGFSWKGRSLECISPAKVEDYAVGRPCVLKEGGIYKMWYSIRSKGPITYRMGYAESHDGFTWTTMDDSVGLYVSQSGWDSEMVCYPCVVDARGYRYMFYNGNRHGSTGFGCAVLES
jgi:hypothetical protein